MTLAAPCRLPTTLSLPQLQDMENKDSSSSLSEKKEIRGSPAEEVEVEALDGVVDTSGVNVRKTLLYIDFRVLPLLAVMYSFALIDRINLGSARVAGMGNALHLEVGERYSIASCLYFVPYILLQIPGNAILRRTGARNLITFIVVGWGAVQTGMAFVKSWEMLTLCRILLGALEAPFFPAMVYIISTWYKRHEVQKRIAAFYLMSITISAFSSIMAYGLSLLNGRSGMAGWSWIFFVEGIITIGLGLVGFFFLPDFPDRNKFLSKEQTAVILRRVQDDRGDSVPDEINIRKVLHHLSDWTLWVYGIMFCCATLPAYMLAYFIPVILSGMGYNTTDSLLLGANNVASQSKRAVVSALTVAWGGIGGILATTVFREKDRPKYLPGLWVTLVAQIVMMLLALVTMYHFRRMNRLAREGKLAGPLEGKPGFYYTL
uniref:Major facilitator superfamily (MFS) profile domain-containing protein n=1 Tax=Moniliophthora roreri TaxID=221103 RepID=A0A0W0FVF7_MONRR